MEEKPLEQSVEKPFNDKLYKSRKHQDWVENFVKKDIIALCRFGDTETCRPQECGKDLSYRCFKYFTEK